MDQLRRVLTQLRNVWQGMSGGRRALAVAVVALALLAAAGLAYHQLHIDFKPLFTNLTPEEAGKLTTALQNKGIPYRLDAGGSTISVPADRLASARVDLAADGMPLTGGKGFELFDESPLGMTPFVQNVNYSRALQAELGRSIMQLDPVAQARVHIVRPEPTPFVREQKPTTASVVLKLKPGAQLNRSSALAIVALVSRAVEGLSPEHVTIVDTRGRLLSDPQPTEDKAHGAQIEVRRDMESYLAAKAEDLLRRHLGVSRAIVRVAADVNLQRVKEKSELVNPEARAATSERISNQKTTGAGSGARGVAGATSNLDKGPGGSRGGAAGSSSQQEKTETDYAVSRTLREQENRANVVERLTVAALIDLSGQGESSAKLTLADARDLIKQAIGFKEGRDDIKVTDVRLGGEAESGETAVPTEQEQSLLLAVRSASLVVGLLLLLLLGILVSRRMWAARKQAAPPAPVAQPPQSPSQITTAPAPEPPPELREFQQLVEDDPERVAKLLARLLEA